MSNCIFVSKPRNNQFMPHGTSGKVTNKKELRIQTQIRKGKVSHFKSAQAIRLVPAWNGQKKFDCLIVAVICSWHLIVGLTWKWTQTFANLNGVWYRNRPGANYAPQCSLNSVVYVSTVRGCVTWERMIITHNSGIVIRGAMPGLFRRRRVHISMETTVGACEGII